MSRAFRQRYAEIPRIIRESRSPADLLQRLHFTRPPEDLAAVTDALVAAALNAGA